MLEDIRQNRINKLEKIKAQGIDPYPSVSNRSNTAKEAILNFTEWSESKRDIVLAGRIRSWRTHGGSTFAKIEDATGAIQIYFKKDSLGDDKYRFLDNFDIGDFIETKGQLFTTKKGEKTLLVSDYKILSKSLRPLPDKWHGLEDQEIRFRKRYLDLIMNKETREHFVTRSQVIRELRNLLEKEGFMEVETPILQAIPGGAAAEPFITHHNALDIDLYLRIAPELYLKRLIVGGFEKVFEIGRNFRNEGADRQHNPDFTELEFYWAYKDYNDLIDFTQKLFVAVVEKIKGGLIFNYQGKKIDFTLPWKRVRFADAIEEASGIDILKTKNLDELRKKIEKIGIKIKDEPNYGKLVDGLYKVTVRKNITSPVIFTDYPIELGPLAKSTEAKHEVVERFQVVVNGFELVNAYSELNDPIDQKNRLLEQVKKYEAGDTESPKELDEDYIEALEYAMPPVAGWGLGVDRFAALLTDSASLREIILFPSMKPEGGKTTGSATGNMKKTAGTDSGAKANISRSEALELIRKNVKNENTIKHMLATEAIMRALAQRFGENEEIWAMAGLLHDVDLENPEALADASKHGLIGALELQNRGVAGEIVDAIKAHNEKTGEIRDTLIKKAIFAADPLTGLIISSVLVRPDKKIANLEVDSVMKKFKDKAFAKGVRRDVIKSSEDFGLNLKEFIGLGLSAMKKIDKELGL